MRVTCTNCGGAHTPWDCKRPAKKSTGAKARASTNHRGSQVAQAVEQGAASVIAQDSSCASSTLALPVDANSLQYQDASSGNADGSKPLTQTKPADPTKRPRGRPKSITDMRTYKAAKQREYRAKWAEVRNRSNTTTERNEG